MKRILALLVSVTIAFNFAAAQSQQLKTFHSFCPGGKEYPNEISWTGYEDELGNVTKHGLFTAKLTKGKVSVNFKQGKLEGPGTIISATKTCNLRYSNDQLISINYVEKDSKGNITIIFKYTLNENGLLVGDFEFKNNEECISIFNDNWKIEKYYFKHIKGKFDASGKATGWWEIELTGDNKGISKEYYEQGYYLGADEKTIEISRAYLIDKKLADKELHNKGFYLMNGALPDLEHKLNVAIPVAQNYIWYLNDFPKEDCISLNLKNNFKLDEIFNGTYLGSRPVSFMSPELYHKQKADLSQFKYDENLKKYYILKVDGESRLYVPLEFEEEFNNLILQKKALEKDKARKEIPNKVIPIVTSWLENLLDPDCPYYKLPNVGQFRSVVNYKINNVEVAESLQECEVFLTVGVGEKKKNEYVSYNTNMTLYNEGYGWKIDSEKIFVKKEHINNIWDSIASVKEKSMEINQQLLSNKEYSTILDSYKNEKITYNNKESDPQKLYYYYTNALEKQKEYLKFIDLVKQINEVSNNIILTAQDESDILQDYQSVSKTWNLNVTGKIADEVRRLKKSEYRNIQDSCLKFIELRKTITKNNTKIAGYSKTAPTIVKAYNTFMQGCDLTWNQDAGRNQAIREILSIQNALLKTLSQPNIGEIEKIVKKSKAKNWEDVKKSIIK